MVDRRAMGWIVGGDSGVSSEAIWAHMMGVSPDPRWLTNHPHDPDDFGRCYRLLVLIPEWRARIGEMAQHGKAWKVLTEHWDELTAMYESEVDLTTHRGPAPKMYARMVELRKEWEVR